METALEAAHVRLPHGSRQLAHALAEGSLAADAGVPAAARVRPLAVSPDGVTFALGAAPGRPATAKVWFQALRAISLTATVTPCIAVLLVLKVLNLPIDAGISALALFGVMALQLGVNLANDVEDHRRLIDLPGSLGGSGIPQRGWLTPREVLRVARALFVLGALLGLPAVLRAPLPMAVVALVAAVGSLGYSGPLLGLKYRALGDLTVLVLCGPALTLGFGVAASGQLVPALIPLGLMLGFLAVGLLHANNLQDAAVDRARGAVTVAGLLGPRRAQAYLVTLYVVALGSWLATALLVQLPLPATLLPLAMLAPTGLMLRAVLRAPAVDDPSLRTLRDRAAQLHLGWGVLAAIAFAVS